MKKKVYLANNIITMERETKPEAILSIDGKIAAVGNRSSVLEQAGKDAQVFDFGNATVLPGFIDAHSHICAYAKQLAFADLTQAKCFDDIVAQLQAYQRNHTIAEGAWLIGYGYDNNFLAEKAHPTKELLDKISDKNPILITHASGHMGVLNTAALARVNMQGNGYLEETAFMQACTHIPAPNAAELENLLQLAQQEYLKYGITTAQEGIAKEQEIQLLKNTPLQLDVVAYIDLKHAKQVYDTGGIYKVRYRDRLRFGGYKIFLDGSPQGKTAWLTSPYEGEATYAGTGVYSDDEVVSFFETALRENVQILVHCNGDAACEQFIRCLRIAQKKTALPIKNRPVMIHAQLVTPAQLAALKELNCVVSFFNAHTYFWGDVHVDNLGTRAQTISPMRTAQEMGLCTTLHQDTPVIAPDMLFSVWCALTRQTRNGQILGKEESVGVYDALKAVTVNAAYQYFEEHDKGTITCGKCCDLAVLDRNPLQAEPQQIKDIRVLATVKAGDIVYERKTV